ncbi:MAG: SCO family protein [Planctomycetota bacterium]|nr:SCO family protein [Planctomycetota bacterium]
MSRRSAITSARAAVLAIACAVFTPALQAQGEGGHSAAQALDIVQAAASMENRVGAMIDRELSFTDERGNPFQFKQLFPGDRPVILVLGYYTCPDMCGQVIHGMLDAINEIDLVPGKDYQLVNVSIDPRETAEVAFQRKQTFLNKLHHVGGPEGWRFLVGEEQSIQALAQTVGFHYLWLGHNNRYDHPGALMFLTPKGELNRVITGLSFEPEAVRLALLEASKGENASFLDKIRLSCLTFDSRTNTYTVTAMTVMRIGGVLTLAGISTMIFLMVRRERQRNTTPATT